MLITRTSQLTGKTNTLDLDVTPEQLERYARGDGYLQTIFNNLPAAQREFIKTGITPDEWTTYFGPGD